MAEFAPSQKLEIKKTALMASLQLAEAEVKAKSAAEVIADAKLIEAYLLEANSPTTT